MVASGRRGPLVDGAHGVQGIATDLLRLVMRHAAQHAARAIYLHVITYNRPAIQFYDQNHFQQAAVLHNFYCLKWGLVLSYRHCAEVFSQRCRVARCGRSLYLRGTCSATRPGELPMSIWCRSGRQLDPSQTMYDAYLYVYYLETGVLPSSTALFHAAVAPLRSMAAHLSVCMPWAPPRRAARQDAAWQNGGSSHIARLVLCGWIAMCGSAQRSNAKLGSSLLPSTSDACAATECYCGMCTRQATPWVQWEQKMQAEATLPGRQWQPHRDK